MHSYTIVGYTADADTWCIRCTTARYGDLSDNTIVAQDGEGNKVHPIFASDEWDYQPSCSACRELLDVCVIQHDGESNDGV